MSVLIETSRGDLVVDLFCNDAPVAARNFLRLCRLKYYNNTLFHRILPGLVAQAGDPTGSGKGGSCAEGVLSGTPQTIDATSKGKSRLLRHERRGTLSASGSASAVGSQFFFTLSPDLDSLDGKHAAFGVVAEGLEVLEAIGEAAVDASGVPLQNIRIKHTLILEDPFLDKEGEESDEEERRFVCREASPRSQGPFEDNGRLEDDWRPASKEEHENRKKRKKKEDGDKSEDDDDESDEQGSDDNDDEAASIAAAAARRRVGAAARAVVLEMVGDLPTADVTPPETVLFVCKLNPVTREQDLEVVFGRFGKIVSCDVVRDYNGVTSLGYAFVGFETRAAAESAYLKMNNVLLDDRRIKVDFSQSVGHLWKKFKSGSSGGRGSGGGGGRGGGGRGQQQQQQQERQRQGGPPSRPLFPTSARPLAQAPQQQGHQREGGEREETTMTARRSRWSPERRSDGGGGGGRREPSPSRRRSSRSRSRSRSPRRRDRSVSRERRRSRSKSRSCSPSSPSSSSRSRSRSRSRNDDDGKKKKKEKEKKKHHHKKHKKHKHSHHHHHDGSDDHKKKKKKKKKEREK